ncbi:MAG: hypothetical protein AB8H86_04780, partial [Polyangiales bacterium]
VSHVVRDGLDPLSSRAPAPNLRTVQKHDTYRVGGTDFAGTRSMAKTLGLCLVARVWLTREQRFAGSGFRPGSVADPSGRSVRGVRT